MQLKAYSIRDLKSEVFNTPFFQKTHGEAERNFRTLVNDPKSTIASFPEDYDLFYIGDYEDNTGTLLPLQIPHHITSANAVRNSIATNVQNN